MTNIAPAGVSNISPLSVSPSVCLPMVAASTTLTSTQSSSHPDFVSPKTQSLDSPASTSNDRPMQIVVSSVSPPVSPTPIETPLIAPTGGDATVGFAAMSAMQVDQCPSDVDIKAMGASSTVASPAFEPTGAVLSSPPHTATSSSVVTVTRSPNKGIKRARQLNVHPSSRISLNATRKSTMKRTNRERWTQEELDLFTRRCNDHVITTGKAPKASDMQQLWPEDVKRARDKWGNLKNTAHHKGHWSAEAASSLKHFVENREQAFPERWSDLTTVSLTEWAKIGNSMKPPFLSVVCRDRCFQQRQLAVPSHVSPSRGGVSFKCSTSSGRSSNRRRKYRKRLDEDEDEANEDEDETDDRDSFQWSDSSDGDIELREDHGAVEEEQEEEQDQDCASEAVVEQKTDEDMDATAATAAATDAQLSLSDVGRSSKRQRRGSFDDAAAACHTFQDDSGNCDDAVDMDAGADFACATPITTPRRLRSPSSTPVANKCLTHSTNKKKLESQRGKRLAERIATLSATTTTTDVDDTGADVGDMTLADEHADVAAEAEADLAVTQVGFNALLMAATAPQATTDSKAAVAASAVNVNSTSGVVPSSMLTMLLTQQSPTVMSDCPPSQQLMVPSGAYTTRCDSKTNELMGDIVQEMHDDYAQYLVRFMTVVISSLIDSGEDAPWIFQKACQLLQTIAAWNIRTPTSQTATTQQPKQSEQQGTSATVAPLVNQRYLRSFHSFFMHKIHQVFGNLTDCQLLTADCARQSELYWRHWYRLSGEPCPALSRAAPSSSSVMLMAVPEEGQVWHAPSSSADEWNDPESVMACSAIPTSHTFAVATTSADNLPISSAITSNTAVTSTAAAVTSVAL